MTSTYWGALFDEALEEVREKSQKRIYRRDPEAWLNDVLGKRWWSKQSEIASLVVDSEYPQTQTAVKSCNGTGKTQSAGDLATWATAVHDPFETSVLLTAPIFAQIRANTMRYIADNHGAAKARGFELPGYFMSIPSLRVDRPNKGELPKDIIQAKRPADQNLISSFQGTHDGYVMVLMDEAGGLPEDMYIAANAVTTNKHVAILAIGNPDEVGTAFHQRWMDRVKYQDWRLLTISAYDTPNFTGEMIYPDDLERDADMKSHLVQVDWAEKMIRQAHPSVVAAKVYGEFPKDSDRSYFTQSTMNKAYDLEIEPEKDAFRTLGVDIAMEGEDTTQMYLNVGGRIRHFAEWNWMDDYMEAARTVHKNALKAGADAVVLDAAGIGASVWSLLNTQAEFKGRPYRIVKFKGSNSSPDLAQWKNMRGWSYDKFREGMQLGKIDLDPEDRPLYDEMLSQPTKKDDRGRLHPMPKDEMKKEGMKSPDHLDAAVYASVDVKSLVEDPVQSLKPGQKVLRSPWEMLQRSRRDTGYPV